MNQLKEIKFRKSKNYNKIDLSVWSIFCKITVPVYKHVIFQLTRMSFYFKKATEASIMFQLFKCSIARFLWEIISISGCFLQLLAMSSCHENQFEKYKIFEASNIFSIKVHIISCFLKCSIDSRYCRGDSHLLYMLRVFDISSLFILYK